MTGDPCLPIPDSREAVACAYDPAPWENPVAGTIVLEYSTVPLLAYEAISMLLLPIAPLPLPLPPTAWHDTGLAAGEMENDVSNMVVVGSANSNEYGLWRRSAACAVKL